MGSKAKMDIKDKSKCTGRQINRNYPIQTRDRKKTETMNRALERWRTISKCLNILVIGFPETEKEIGQENT